MGRNFARDERRKPKTESEPGMNRKAATEQSEDVKQRLAAGLVSKGGWVPSVLFENAKLAESMRVGKCVNATETLIRGLELIVAAAPKAAKARG